MAGRRDAMAKLTRSPGAAACGVCARCRIADRIGSFSATARGQYRPMCGLWGMDEAQGKTSSRHSLARYQRPHSCQPRYLGPAWALGSPTGLVLLQALGGLVAVEQLAAVGWFCGWAVAGVSIVSRLPFESAAPGATNIRWRYPA